MQWLDGLQQSLTYIEEHLDEDIDKEKLAAFIDEPFPYYQRLFQMMCGISLSMYVRNRRLSAAGERLLQSKDTILSIALTYGYETCESFTRAFTRFHGVTPSYARKQQIQLHTYTPIQLQVKRSGGSSLSYHVVEADAFTVSAYRQSFSTEAMHYHQDIPAFWESFFAASSYPVFCEEVRKQNIPMRGILGIDEMAMMKEKDTFYYYAGIAADIADKDASLITFPIPAHTWLVFEVKGVMPQAIQEVWIQIYQEFFPSKHYVPCCDYHFECYDPDHMTKAQIWVPVEQR